MLWHSDPTPGYVHASVWYCVIPLKLSVVVLACGICLVLKYGCSIMHDHGSWVFNIILCPLGVHVVTSENEDTVINSSKHMHV